MSFLTKKSLKIAHSAMIIASLLFLLIILHLPSLRPFFKYADQLPSLLIYFIFLCPVMACCLILKKQYPIALKKISISSDTLFWGLTAILFIFSIIGFQYELKLQVAQHGSDSSNALILFGQELFKGHFPYHKKTYLGNPISPGPGWGLLNLPFSSTLLYPLLIPFWISLTGYLLKKRKHSLCACFYYFLCFSSLSFWELTFSGIDLLAIGAAFSSALLLMDPNKNFSFALSMLLSVFLGFLMTSRIIFVYLLFPYAILLYKKQTPKAFFLSLTALLTPLLLNGIFYIFDPNHFSPLHLLSKGQYSANIVAVAALLILALITAIYLLFASYKTYSNIFLNFTLALIAPLLVLSLTDLIHIRQWHTAQWEGANYIGLCIPIIAAYIALKKTELNVFTTKKNSPLRPGGHLGKL